MNGRFLAAVAAAALIYGGGCFVPTGTPTPPVPSKEPSIAPVEGRTYTYQQKAGTLKFHVDKVDGDTVTYSLTQTSGTTSDLKATRTHGVFWVLAAPNPLTQDIDNYPSDGTLLADIGYFKTRRVNVDVDHVYWIAQSLIIKALEGSVVTTLTAID